MRHYLMMRAQPALRSSDQAQQVVFLAKDGLKYGNSPLNIGRETRRLRQD